MAAIQLLDHKFVVIERLSHITLVVHDLDRMSKFMKGIFDAEEVYVSGDDTHSISRERFYIIGDVWVAIMEGKSLPERSYNHVAFKVSNNDFDMYIERVRNMDVKMRVGRPRIEGEAQSLYFYDYDNHLFELHTGTLNERLKTYERIDR